MHQPFKPKPLSQKMKTKTLILLAGMFSGFVATAHAQNSDFYGEVPVEVNDKTHEPKNTLPDPYGNPLFVDGRTDTPLDARSMAAFEVEKQQKLEAMRKQIDRSIRADIGTGQPVTVLIAPEHFVQLTFMRNGEIVFPRRAFTGQPAALIIEKKENSPYVYIAASAMVDGQSTNLFVETEEDGRVQTYVVKLMVTEPKNIREQVAVNLVNDQTPPIRGITPPEDGFGGVAGTAAGAPAANGTVPAGQNPTSGAVGVIGSTVGGKFTTDETKKYLNTMIQMAEHFNDAKQIEKASGKAYYKDHDIKPYPSGQYSYIDPVEGTSWMVHQIWFFPRYDAILLDVRCHNPNQNTSMWDYSQMKWQANQSPTQFASTAAAPEAMQTLSGKTNRIWYLIQGNRLDPQAEFSPVFPRPDRRGNNGGAMGAGGTGSQSPASTK